MSYYKVLGFNKEPFSTSPDPTFFYESREHEMALTNLMIDLRLKRGLNLILGDVGTGKTTLSRKLFQLLRSQDKFITHMILDPVYNDEETFLTYLLRNFDIEHSTIGPAILNLKEALEKFLYQKGVEENRTVILIIDEAQKLNEMTLECLRVLLNYETNEFKLLQLVLLGQMELYPKIMNITNFMDRISFKFTLNPLNEEETKQLIEFRVKQAGYNSNMHLFLEEATKEIYRYSRGYPRRINMLCHKALKALVMKNKFVVDYGLIKEMIDQEMRHGLHTYSYTGS
ncbi:MAG: AAA family ATPase [Candidatus Omnitrophica bacterium]|nr:AAA family ATPase [Candidatus Omnitrophota bacterium]MBU1925660.1 AAA family ATPase [Candidatus Omnitrophota bacterium]